jgi:REP element-mobilizing transposase RayT
MPIAAKQMGLFAPAQDAGRTRRGRPGRKPREERKGFVPHRTRPAHHRRHPVHVSIRRVRLAPSLRSERVYAAIVAELVRAAGVGVRVVHYSVQDDHVHLMVEGRDAKDLSNQMRKLFSRVALAVNAVAKRRGSLFRDRHHRRELTSPTQTRHALVYILFNERKHAGPDSVVRRGGGSLEWLDERSSAPWFEGWHPDARPPPELAAHARAQSRLRPVTSPRTWLAQTGWRRAGGLVRFHELPRFAPTR